MGGGAVLFSLSNKNINEYIVNDISNELVMLYKYIKNNNSVFHQCLGFNKSGGFSIPYGGMNCNRKDF